MTDPEHRRVAHCEKDPAHPPYSIDSEGGCPKCRAIREESPREPSKRHQEIGSKGGRASAAAWAARHG
jgi:hypothetical protein